MPNRFIKESCRSSRNLDKLTDFEERLFWRLITTADDYGRFYACPELVRSSCFPYKQSSIALIQKSLNSLQGHRLIQLYRINDRLYGYFVTWEKHQGKPRASKPKYPEPLGTFMQADASTCSQALADAPGGPDTETNTNLNSSSLNSLKSKNHGKTTFPSDWKPPQEEMEQWRTHGIASPWVEFASFRDHALANDRRCKDWHAAWRNWCRKALKMKEDGYGLRQVRS